MPIDLRLRYHPSGALVPDNAVDAEVMQQDLAPGVQYRATLTRPRGGKFHRLVLGLIRYCFDLWEPEPLLHAGMAVERSFEAFRAELLILAGHYRAIYRVDGSVRLEPKSISFARCDEIEFRRVFGNLINVALRHLPRLAGMSPEALEAAAQRVLAFER